MFVHLGFVEPSLPLAAGLVLACSVFSAAMFVYARFLKG